jgi:preprotein translocase subunit SecD
VQGFAITMMLGVLATLISGLFVLKSLFTFILDGLKFERISI